MDGFQRITSFLRTLRSRLNRVSLLTAGVAVMLTLTVSVSLSLVIAYLGWDSSSLVVLVLGALGAVWLTFRIAWMPRRKRRSDEALARWLETRVDDLESGVITSVQVGELLTSSLAGEKPLRFSPNLAMATVQRTLTRLDRLHIPLLVDRTSLVRLTRAWILLILVLALGFKLSPQVFTGGLDRLLTGGSEVVGIVEVDAIVSDLHLEIQPPAYLRAASKKMARTGGDVVAMEGTRVKLSAHRLAPEGMVTLVLESDPEGRWPLEHTSDGHVSGRFMVGAPDRYSFMTRTADGVWLREKRWRTVDVRSDHAPEVHLHQPDADLEVHEGDDVQFFYEATDDHGLSRLDLCILGTAGGEMRRLTIAEGEGLRVKRGSYALAAASLELRPGQSAEVYVEAFDHNDVTGPGVGRSNQRVITMYSPDAKHEALLEGLSAVMDAMIDLLADRLESPITVTRDRNLPVATSWHQDMSGRQERVVASLGALVTSASVDPFAPETLLAALREVHSALQSVHEQESVHLTSASRHTASSRDARVLFTMLGQVNAEGVSVTETGVLTLKDLVEESRQSTVLERGRHLLDAQLELMDLLEKMRDGDDPALMEQVEQKLRELEANLARMQQEMSKLAERVPYENQNPQQEPQGTESDMRDIGSELEEIRRLMEEGKVEEALARLESLTRSTQALMAGLQDDFATDSQSMAEGTREMSEFSESVQELADAQQAVHDETREVEQQQQEQARKEMEARLNEALEEMVEQASRVEQGLGACPGGGLHPQDRQALQQLREDAAMLKKAIMRREIDDSLERARKIAKQAPGLASEVLLGEEREMNVERGRQMRTARENLGESGREAASLAERLEEITKDPQQTVSGESRRAMRRLKSRQNQLRKEASRMSKNLDALEAHVPGIRPELEEILKGARGAMDQAGEGLAEQDASRANRHQREALDRLGEAQKAIERRLAQQPSGGPERGVGVNRSQQRVEIPEKGDAPAEVEFRQELIRAMKEVAPEEFKESIKRYYEELVR